MCHLHDDGSSFYESRLDTIRDEETADMEPSPEPMVSRYRTTNRSLGLKFPQTLSDPIVRAEGIIVWLHHRCEKRISRGNKPTTNELRKQTLVGMISACSRGMSEREKLTADA